MKVKLPVFECLVCGHKWHPLKEEVPLRCGFCKSPRWPTAPAKPSQSAEKHRKECRNCHTDD